jgi:large subunit ribosomal protein L13
MIEEAVWGMLPKNKIGRKMLKKLKVYRGTAHPHQAQQPETLSGAGNTGE